MEIIIEYTLIDNLVIDFLILYLSSKILKNKIVFWKLALSSAIGAGCALALPIMNFPSFVLITFKLILGVVMVLISLPSQRVKKFFISFLTFLAMTAVMGGVCFLIIFAISGQVTMDILVQYNSAIPIGVILLICSISTYIISKLIKLFYKKKEINNFVYQTTFFNEGKEVVIDAYLDSGNTLIDPISNKPVVIIDYSLFNKLFNLPLEKVLTKQIEEKEIKKSHYISFNTVGQKSNMLVFEIEQLTISLSNKQVKKLNDVVLGLSFSKLSGAFSCGALLHPQLFC